MCNTIAYPTHSHPYILVVYPVPTNEAMTTESQRYKLFIRNEGNAIPQQACTEIKGSIPASGLTLLWACNSFRGNSKHWEILSTGTSHKKKREGLFPKDVTEKKMNHL